MITNFDLHTQAMELPEYSIHHVPGFPGPGWLNVGAMQAAPKPNDRIKFRPCMLYNVYDKEELNYGSPKWSMLSIAELTTKMYMHKTNISKIINHKVNSRYNIIESGRAAVEWSVDNGEEVLVFYNNREACAYLGIKQERYLAEKIGKFTKGCTLSRRYVKVNLSCEILEVMG